MTHERKLPKTWVGFEPIIFSQQKQTIVFMSFYRGWNKLFSNFPKRRQTTKKHHVCGAFLIDSVWVARHCRSWLGFTTRLELFSSRKADQKEGHGEDIRPISAS